MIVAFWDSSDLFPSSHRYDPDTITEWRSDRFFFFINRKKRWRRRRIRKKNGKIALKKDTAWKSPLVQAAHTRAALSSIPPKEMMGLKGHTIFSRRPLIVFYLF